MQERVTDEFIPHSGAEDRVGALRALCLMYLDRGMPVVQVARLLGRSRQWVYRTKRLGVVGVRDRRRRSNSHVLDEAVRLREELGCGPTEAVMLLRSRGLDVPSVATIAAEFRRRHINTGRVGFVRPRPMVHAPLTGHGEELSLDIWGPWAVPGIGRVLALTGMDSFSRAAGGVLWRQLDAEAHARSLAYLVDRLYSNHWPVRVLISHRLGFALTQVDGQLAPLVRLALAHGAIPTFLPEAQPWNNGRLQRFHATQEREFWRLLPDGVEGSRVQRLYLEWLDYYNCERVHMAIRPNCPADLARGYYRPFVHRPDPPRTGPVVPRSGRVEYWRHVHAGGWIELHGELVRLHSSLAGQQVIVRLEIRPGEAGSGEIFWQPDGGRAPVWVASVVHDYEGGQCIEGSSVRAGSRLRLIRMVRRNQEIHDDFACQEELT